MPAPSFPNDVETKVSLAKEIAIDIVRLQGEELIRVRRELEKAQNLNQAAFELIRATDQHVSGMQNAFRGRHTQISSLEAVIVNLQRENDSSLVSLENIRESMRKFCGSSFVDFETRSPNSSESTLPQDRFVDNQSDLKGSNKLDSLQNESEVVDGQEDIVSIDDELKKSQANRNIPDVLESSEAQAHDSPHSTNALVSPEEPVSQFSRYNDSEVEILRQDLVDAVSHANNLQYHLDAALEANEALEEKVMELSSQAQAAHSDNVKEEHTNNSYDAGEKHDSALLADEPSTSLKDVVVGQPDSIPAAVPVPQATHGTSADVVDSPKSAIVDQPNSPVVNDRSGSLPPPTSHVNSENTASSLTANPLQHKFVSAMSLCHPINLAGLPTKAPARITQMDKICSEVIGYSPTFLQGSLRGKLIINLHNQNGATLIAVSKDANTLCELLTKELSTHWKNTFLVMEGGPGESKTTKQLYVLVGEYAYCGSSPSQLALSDYKLLPDAAKDFIVYSAKSLRHEEIKTKQQLLVSLVQPGGIVVHGITLETVRPREALEQLVAEEARRRGVLQVTKTGAT